MIPPYIQNDVAGNSIPPFNTVFLKFTIFLGSTTVHRWRTLLKFVTPPTQLRCRFMRIELFALKIFSLIADWSKSAWAMIKRWWTKIFKAKRRLSIYTRRLNSILRGLAGEGVNRIDQCLTVQRLYEFRNRLIACSIHVEVNLFCNL